MPHNPGPAASQPRWQDSMPGARGALTLPFWEDKQEFPARPREKGRSSSRINMVKSQSVISKQNKNSQGKSSASDQGLLRVQDGEVAPDSHAQVLEVGFQHAARSYF